MESCEVTIAARRRVIKKVLWRLMPLLGLLYFVSYLDRISLAYAGPGGMNDELGLTSAAFGLASGVFFVGYILFEVPSNIVMQTVGAKRWLTRIIISWGLVQTLMAFVPNEQWLYVMRVLLGIAEAGFAPGVLLLLTYWIPVSRRTWAFAVFLLVPNIANIVGGPFATWLIGFGDTHDVGLSGWRLMILVTGLMAVAAGMMGWFLLVDTPNESRWLTAKEKVELAGAIDAENDFKISSKSSILGGLKDRRVWALGFAFFAIPYAAFTMTFFLPTMVVAFQTEFDIEFSTPQRSFLTALPFVAAVIGALIFARIADRIQRHGLMVAAAVWIGAVGILLATVADGPYAILASLCLAAFGFAAPASALFNIIPKIMAAAAVAATLALVNSLGSFGGFLGPYITGILTDTFGNQNAAFYIIALLLVLSGITCIIVDRSAEQYSAAQKSSTGAQSAIAGVDQKDRVTRME